MVALLLSYFSHTCTFLGNFYRRLYLQIHMYGKFRFFNRLNRLGINYWTTALIAYLDDCKNTLGIWLFWLEGFENFENGTFLAQFGSKYAACSWKTAWVTPHKKLGKLFWLFWFEGFETFEISNVMCLESNKSTLKQRPFHNMQLFSD